MHRRSRLDRPKSLSSRRKSLFDKVRARHDAYGDGRGRLPGSAVACGLAPQVCTAPTRRLSLMVCLILALVPLLFIPSTVLAASLQDQRAQHAQLVSSKPAAGAILQSPPSSIQMWFSEALIPATSEALVVDTTNRQIDMQDSHVNAGNGKEMDLSLPLVPAGTYVVVWQTQSAIDGHIGRGSFLFRIARPDGSIPPIPNVLPTGHFPGAGGVGVQSGTSLDGPTLLQTLATWISLLLLTFWVGGIIWETWIFAPGTRSSPDSSTAIGQASRQWRTYTPHVLVGILIANTGIICGQAAELAGNWSGTFSWPLLHAILFESSFGTFWWLREGVTLAALLFTVVLIGVRHAPTHKLQRQDASREPAAREENTSSVETGSHADPALHASSVQDTIPYGAAAIMQVLASMPRLPRHLIAGIRQRSWYGHIEGVLALTLIYAFALSGHAAAVSSSTTWTIIGIDLLHLLADAAWIGGLLYIGIVLLPTLNKQSNDDWANVLTIGLPRFGVIAITSVILLATTGSFNTTVHLTSFEQFWTTAYGRTLTVKIITFMSMIGISAYHAFFLRPRLAYALAETRKGKALPASTRPAEATADINPPHPQLAGTHGGKTSSLPANTRPAETTTDTNPPHPPDESTSTHEETLSPRVRMLGKSLERWLLLEGILGAIVLLCVALLAAFAGSLAASTSPTPSSQPTGPVTQTQTVDGYTITLKVTPATFGTNTFLVLVKDRQGQPQTGAAVLLRTSMLDMDMGTETVQLQADPKQPGAYSQQADLTMAGHWAVTVRILPANSNNFVTATFNFSAS